MSGCMMQETSREDANKNDSSDKRIRHRSRSAQPRDPEEVKVSRAAQKGSGASSPAVEGNKMSPSKVACSKNMEGAAPGQWVGTARTFRTSSEDNNRSSFLLVLNPLAWHESMCRLFLNRFGDWCISWLPHTERLISYSCLYMGLQVMGILWGFVINVFGQLSLMMGSLAFTRKEQSVIQAVSTLYVIWSIIRIIVVFARFLWRFSWESMSDFPSQRKMVLLDRNARLVMAGLLCMMMAMTAGALFAPFACKDITHTYDTWAGGLCHVPGVKQLANEESKTHRILKLCVIIGLAQWLLFLLYEIPDWCTAFRKRPIPFVILSVASLLLQGVTAIWAVDWVADTAGLSNHLVQSLTGYPRNMETVGMGLLLAWQVFYLVLVTTAPWSPKPATAAQDRLLRPVFKKFKWVLMVMLIIQFCKSSVDVNRGLLLAMEDSVITSIVLPSGYVLLYSISDMLMRSSWPMLCLLLGAGSAIAALACSFSGLVGQMTFVLVTLNFASKCVKEYGHHRLYKDVVLDLPNDNMPWLGSGLSVLSLSRRKPSDLTPTLHHADGTDPLLSPDSTNDVTTMELRLGFVSVSKAVLKMSLGLVAIFTMVMVLLASLSAAQEKAGWFPNSITMDETDKEVHIQHVQIIDMWLERNGSNGDFGIHPVDYGSPPHYSVCAQTWHNLTILDYAFIAQVAYFDVQEANVTEVLNAFFPGNAPKFEARTPPPDMMRGGHALFFEAYSKELDLSVISVRGTDVGRIGDFIEDVRLYTEPVVYVILTWVFPLMRLWPDRAVSVMVELFHEGLALIGLRNDNWYYNAIVKYVDQITATDPTRHVIITGHSLGGGMARIAGYLTGRASVSFSAPGIYHSYRKVRQDKMFTFKTTRTGEKVPIDRHTLHHKTVNIVPEHDLIAQIDAQAGSVQHIRCFNEEKALQNSCHMLQGTICELIARCGDTRGRFQTCRYSYNVTNFIPFAWSYIAPFVVPLGPVIALLAIKYTLLPLL